QVFLVDEELDVQPVQPTVDVPVDVAEVVAHAVGAIVAELDAVPTAQAAPLALHAAAKYAAREQRQALELRQKPRREDRLACRRHPWPSLSLVERLEVAPDLIVEVTWHLLPRDRVLHLFTVLADDPQVLEPRGHGAAASGQVGVVAFLASLPRFALDADVVGRGAKALGRLALRRVAPTPAGHEPFTLAEVLVFRTRAVATSPAAPAAAAIALAPPAQVFPRPLRFVHRPHLVESPLHRVEGAVWLASLERLHAFHRVAAPVVAALSAEPLHLLEQ